MSIVFTIIVLIIRIRIDNILYTNQKPKIMKRFYPCLVMCGLALGLAACSDSETGTENGHEWVDLGLPSGTKWATCNIGADNPADNGNYYSWGEVTTKDAYSWNNYTHGAKEALTKYCTKSAFGDQGVADGETTLDDEDNAARVNWGGDWTMPTKAQIDELQKECVWVWTIDYNNTNVKGCIVYKAKKDADKGKFARDGELKSYSLNDTHIFLPAAGFRIDTGLGYVGSYGGYWTLTLDERFQTGAWSVYFNSEKKYEYGEGYRCYGQSIRPVITED